MIHTIEAQYPVQISPIHVNYGANLEDLVSAIPNVGRRKSAYSNIQNKFVYESTVTKEL